MSVFIDVMNEHNADVEEVIQWCNQEYKVKFAEYFIIQHQLYDRLKSSTPITDAELETILTDIPLKLFKVSEILSAFRTGFEVLKLKIKEKSANIEKSSEAKSQAARKEEANIGIIPDMILTTAYESIISRVEYEISMSKELIMGAKKIWDSRRRTDNSNPVGEVVNDELPEYIPKTTKTYIK